MDYPPPLWLVHQFLKKCRETSHFLTFSFTLTFDIVIFIFKTYKKNTLHALCICTFEMQKVKKLSTSLIARLLSHLTLSVLHILWMNLSMIYPLESHTLITSCNPNIDCDLKFDTLLDEIILHFI